MPANKQIQVIRREMKPTSKEFGFQEKITSRIPGDPDSQNNDRAMWALSAIREFRTVTGVDPEDSIADLVCDLAHLCDRIGICFDAEIMRASQHYSEEAPGGVQFLALGAP